MTRLDPRRLVTESPYRPVIAHPVLRRVLPGIGLSALGAGMAPVAVSWLALELAPDGREGTWVSVAVVAYILPGAIGALAFGRFLNGRSGSQLAGWDALVRAVAFAAIPLAVAFGVLGIGLFATLLAISSLLLAWGKAGRYTMLSELLPREHHLAGNSLVNLMLEISTVVGPLIAAGMIKLWGAPSVFAAAAATFAVLAGTYRLAVPPGADAGPRPGASRSAGLRAIAGDRGLAGLLVLTFGFFLCYGPVTVALPLYATRELDGSVALLAGFYTAFGIGAVLGALLSGYLKGWPLIPTTIGIVLGFGVVLLPVASGGPVLVSWIAYGLCGLLWGPFPTTTTTLFQRRARADLLAQVLAARVALTSLAVPLGAALGGPAVVALGAGGTIRAAAVGLILLGAVAGLVGLLQRRPTPGHHPPERSGDRSSMSIGGKESP